MSRGQPRGHAGLGKSPRTLTSSLTKNKHIYGAFPVPLPAHTQPPACGMPGPAVGSERALIQKKKVICKNQSEGLARAPGM